MNVIGGPIRKQTGSLLSVLLYFNILIINVHAQELNSYSSAIVRLPFIFDGRVTIPVKIKNTDFNDLIFDSAISSADAILIMHNETGEELGLDYVQTIPAARGAGAGENKDVHISVNNEVRFGQLNLDNLILGVLDETKDSSLFHNVGVVGNALLSRYIIEIDFDTNSFCIYDTSGFVIDPGWEEIPLNMEKGFAFINTIINIDGTRAIPVKLIIDTGAKEGLGISIDSTRYIFPPKNSTFKLIGTGLRGPVFGVQGQVHELQFGSYTLKNVTTGFSTKGDIPALENFSCDGVIGIEALRRFNIVFDFGRGKLYINPNSSLNEPFEFNMAGLDIVETGIGEKVVLFVVEGSQAEKNGIKKGDIITSINEIDANSLNDPQIQDIFSQKGQKVTVKYLRGGETHQTTIELKSIY